MPFDNYTDLIDKIDQYLLQYDISGQVEDFITLAEKRMDREVRHRLMSGTKEGFLGGSDSVTLPAQYAETITWRVTTPFPGLTLTRVPPDRFFDLYAASIPGPPQIYTIIGNEAFMAPNPETAGTDEFPYKLFYYSKVPPLTLTNSTNWLLDAAPDLYLYGALLEAEPFVLNDERMATWEKMYERGRASLNASDARARYRPGSVMRPETYTRDGKRYST
jgi:hypothetical protein